MSRGSYQGGKVGYGISTSRYNKMANNRMESENYIKVEMEIARADSRVLFSL